ncbi:MAG: hypothetical protein ACYDHY_13020 [Acidiferrobacterales bacterium]
MALPSEEKRLHERRKANAEKQARFRYRALHDPDGLLLVQVRALVSAHAAANLKRLRTRTGWTLRQCVERGIKLAYEESAAKK